MEIDPSDQTHSETKRVLTSAVSPRPIAWISTTSEDGVDNLAPYSSYNYLSHRNPVVQFNSPNADHGGPKDTARNALATGEFAVNVVTADLIERMDHTSERLPPGESEFDTAGLTRAECRRIDPPRVAEAAITMECSVYDSMEILDRLTVFGEVELFRVDDEVLTDGKVDSLKLPTVGRLGGPYYTISEPHAFERQY